MTIYKKVSEGVASGIKAGKYMFSYKGQWRVVLNYQIRVGLERCRFTAPPLA
jgi:hypothetical protein